MRHDDNSSNPQAVATTVRALYDAFLKRRREEAEALLAPDFTFTSPYDDAIDRNAYFARCWPNGDRFQSFEIERVAADADGAFVTYHCTTNEGASFRNSEYLTVKDGRVTSVNVYFGATYRDGKFVTQQADVGA
jgi:ketosteroid isomerase-like protein